MSFDNIFVYILLAFLIGIILYILIKRLSSVIKSYLNGYKNITGYVIKYIDQNDEEYIKKQREKVKNDNLKLYKFLSSLENFNNSLPKSTSESNIEDDPAYFAVIEYVVDNKKYTIQNTIGSDIKGKTGKKIKLRYNPKNPEEAILSFDKGSLVAIICLLFFILIIFWVLSN